MADTNTKERYIEAIGRRKEAVARVRIKKAAKNSVAINGKDVKDYFPTKELQAVVNEPFGVYNGTTNYTVTAVIKGGGHKSQAEALALGISRALVKAEPETKPVIKKAKLLTRDARVKERYKFGLKKARKAPQWSKR